MSVTASPRLRGALQAATGVLIVSFDALLVRLAATDGWTVAFWRGLGIAATLLPVAWLWPADDADAPADTTGLWLASSLMAGSSLSLVLAFTLTHAANAVVILSAAPLFAALISRFTLGERCPRRTWAAILLCCGGVVLVMAGSLGGGRLGGDLLALVSTILIGGYFTLFRRYPHLPRARAIGQGGLFCALVATCGAHPWGLPAASYGWLALAGLVQMPLAMLLLTRATRTLPAAEVSLFLLLETVVSPLWVWAVLGEPPPGITLAGGGLILVTLVIHTLAGWRSDNPP